MWVGRLFYIPAFAGGIFGLLGGYLTDLLGRRRVLTFSILFYAVGGICLRLCDVGRDAAGAAVFRLCGVCVEFVAAVAWLAELFPHPLQREKRARLHAGVFLAGWTDGGDGQWPLRDIRREPAGDRVFGLDSSIADPHAAWRYTLMTGVIPAIPVILIRPFLPESPSGRKSAPRAR